MIRALILAAGCLALAAGGATAQVLRIGLASEPTAVDPHYHQLSPNAALARHLFDGLVAVDASLKRVPQLATTWETRGDDTWIFTLRQGVRFSNGAAFEAKDVIFTFCRLLHNDSAVSGSYGEAIRNIASAEARDPHTLVVTTKAPDPLLPTQLANVAILWNGLAKHDTLAFAPERGCGVTSAWPRVNDFNEGGAVIGTGPYTLRSYVKGGVIELARNEGYWGEKPAWSEVRMTPVARSGPRLAGLLAGDYDLIESPAARDLDRLKQDARFGHVITPSNRVIFLQLDVARDPSPFIRNARGNPFADLRVRRAVSLAIDRKAIALRIMDGAAAPANQFLPPGMFGSVPDLAELAYDPRAAKALLAEAGYPEGFGVTLAATNDRYVNDAQIVQAVAQYLTQVGIRTEVEAMTRSIFFTRRARREFSFAMGGWGSDTGEASSFLQYWVASTNKDLGVGSSNYGGFSDTGIDRVLLQAMATIDPAAREPLLQRAVRLTMAELPSIPLHFESSIWAFRKGVTYEGRADQYTLAMSTKPVD